MASSWTKSTTEMVAEHAKLHGLMLSTPATAMETISNQIQLLNQGAESWGGLSAEAETISSTEHANALKATVTLQSQFAREVFSMTMTRRRRRQERIRHFSSYDTMIEYCDSIYHYRKKQEC